MYPLCDDYETGIKQFIYALRECKGIEVLTNQMSTQIRGEFSCVTEAVNGCMRTIFEGDRKIVLVTKWLNADLNIGTPPRLD